MKKTLNHIFDEANAREIENLVKRNSAPEVSADTLSSVKDKVYAKTNLKKVKNTGKSVWLRLGAVAACIALIVSAVLVLPMLREDAPELDPDNRANIPILNVQAPPSGPQYYGSELSENVSNSEMAEVVSDGISVTAKFLEALPDTYTFFDDWNQTEFRLIKLETLSLITGSAMADVFYFIVPVEYMTDFSVYDTFVISHMGQFGCDYSVLYNVTKQHAESIDAVIFGRNVHRYNALGTSFMAFNEKNMIDLRLWNSTDAWRSATRSWVERGIYDSSFTKQEAETEALEQVCGVKVPYVHTLDRLSGEAKNVLEKLKSFEYGIFAPSSANKLWYDTDASLLYRRYINGFATNETISLEGENTVIRSKAQFSADDLAALPNLSAAYAAIKSAFENRDIQPPHIQYDDGMNNTVNGIFGWYAKTSEGIIGIVRVNWCYVSSEYDLCFDDAYYIIEYGANVCVPTDRDDLLRKIGDHEATYIYTGEYDEFGKVYDRNASIE